MSVPLRLALLVAVFLLSACQPTRYLFYNFADVRDYRKFPARPIAANGVGFKFYAQPLQEPPHSYPPAYRSLEDFLENTHTLAFLLIQRDTIKYERYFKGYHEASVVPSFSMAKSVVSILLGAAIDDGYIHSVSDKLSRYLPAMQGFDEVTLEHLLQMTAGVRFNENYYLPFSDAARFYYGRQLRKKTRKLKPEQPPGQSFHYNSGSTQLLAMALESSLPEGISLSAYLEQRIWQPLAMEYPASWSIDQKKQGIEKAFCCLNARARDFARLGRLYLQKGCWEGRQIISSDWVERSLVRDTTEGSVSYYQYQWWLPSGGKGEFLANGYRGQYLYVNPAKELIIVRLGRKAGGLNWSHMFSSWAMGY